MSMPKPSPADAIAAGMTPDRPDWNVVVTLPENGFREARRLLRRWGVVRRSGYYNVLVMTVPDVAAFLADFAAAVRESPGILNFVSHVLPAQATFAFDGVEAFEAHAREVALGWVEKLAGKRFHVRMHRRGLKGELSTPHEERFLDEALLAALHAAGPPGRIDFEDPDAVIRIETVDGRAGMSLWTRDDLASCPFLGSP